MSVGQRDDASTQHEEEDEKVTKSREPMPARGHQGHGGVSQSDAGCYDIPTVEAEQIHPTLILWQVFRFRELSGGRQVTLVIRRVGSRAKSPGAKALAGNWRFIAALRRCATSDTGPLGSEHAAAYTHVYIRGDKVKSDGQECPSYTVKGWCVTLEASGQEFLRLRSGQVRSTRSCHVLES